jgi:regulatory protein
MTAETRRSAKDRALGLLAVRWRSRAELRTRLRQAGFEPDEIQTTLADLESAGLVNDQRFATELVRDRAGRRLAGSRAIRTELRQKGVPDDLVDQAVAESEQDEESRAFRLAQDRARQLGSLPPETAQRRLLALLQRRGYGYDLARRAALHALDPERQAAGWEPDDGS